MKIRVLADFIAVLNSNSFHCIVASTSSHISAISSCFTSKHGRLFQFSRIEAFYVQEKYSFNLNDLNIFLFSAKFSKSSPSPFNPTIYFKSSMFGNPKCSLKFASHLQVLLQCKSLNVESAHQRKGAVAFRPNYLSAIKFA